MTSPSVIDVVVVGAGPAGSTAARLLAEAGLDVLVLEEHAQVGSPVHCTGIVGEEIFREFGIPRDLVQSRLPRFRVFGPGGSSFDLPTNGRSQAYALDRHALDAWVAERACGAGARLVLSARVRSIVQDAAGVRVTWADGEVTARLCVLACGAMSNLPERSGIVPPRAYFRTVQAGIASESLQGAEIYLGSRFAAGSFAYAVGTGSGAGKAGVISRGSALRGWRNLLEEVGNQRLTRDTWRRIPMGACRRSVAGRVLAVGDAAGQTKTTTGGGIFYAMLCARICAQTVVAARRGNDFRLRDLHAYDAAWRRRIGLEIQAGLWMRGFFEQVADDDVERLVRVVASGGVQDVLQREWDFDFHHGLLLGLARVPELRRHFVRMAAGTFRAQRLLGFILTAVDLGWSERRLRGGASS